MLHSPRKSRDNAPHLPENTSPAGLYVHVPFCLGRCRYCGFVSHPFQPERMRAYGAALKHEILLWARQIGSDLFPGPVRFDTLYFGGGTPSLMDARELAELIERCMATYSWEPPVEITVELNPGSVRRSWLREAMSAGVNRFSLGIQSLHDTELRAMGRRHSASASFEAFQWIRDAGCDNVSVDLLVGYPGQTRESVLDSVHGILSLKPEHISMYLLEIKDGSELARSKESGTEELLDDDLAADMYEDVVAAVASAGFEQYEIANFALPGRRSRHNCKYWTDIPYLGIGAGAHGFTGTHRTANCGDLTRYIDQVSRDRLPLTDCTRLSPESRMREALMMGLRLVEGLDLADLGSRYNLDAEALVSQALGDLDSHDLYRRTGSRIALTARGRLLSNLVFERLID